MKKRLLCLIVAFFIIAALSSSLAEDSVSIDFVYGDMEEFFAQALSPGALPGDVQANFENIVSLYEANPGVQDLEYAAYYYCYACGYLAFLREDWAAAKVSFDKCRIYNMGEEEIYYNFAMGMLYAQNEDYARAIPMFDAAASGGGAISSRALNKSLECTRLYQDGLRDAGKAALAAGDYQTALSYFDALRTEFPESDGAALYDECLARSGAAQARDEMSVRVLSGTQAEVSWISTREKCRLFVSMTLDAPPAFEGAARESVDGEALYFDAGLAVNAWNVEGGQAPRTAVLERLLPGTAYALWMEDAQSGELLRSGVFVTEAAPPHATLRVDRSVLYAYQQTAYEMTRSALKEEASFWATLSDVLQGQAGYDVVLSPSAAGEVGYALVFRAVDADGRALPREAFVWRELTALLHLDGIATVCYEEAFGAESSILEAYNAELTVLRFSDLLRNAERLHDIPAGTAYTLTVLLDGARFLEISGNVG